MHYPKTALGVCTIAHFMNDGMTVVLSIILPFLISKYGLSYYQAGLIVTCFYVTQAVVHPLLGYASDRTGRRKIYIGLGLILFSISLYAFQYAQTYALRRVGWLGNNNLAERYNVAQSKTKPTDRA